MFFPDVVISYGCSTNVNIITWRLEIYTELARAWDTGQILTSVLKSKIVVSPHLKDEWGLVHVGYSTSQIWPGLCRLDLELRRAEVSVASKSHVF